MFDFFQQKIKIIFLSKGLKQSLINILGNYFSAFVAAIAIILISRNLGPELFGDFSAAFSLSIIFAKLNDAGLTVASQKFASQSRNKKETKSFIYYGYKLKFIISLIIIVFSIAFSPFLTRILKFSNIYIAPVSIFFGLSITYYDQLVSSLLATHSFIKAILVNMSQALFKLISSIFFTILIHKKELFPILYLFLFAPGFPVLLKKYFEPKWFQKIKSANLTINNKKKYISLAKHSAILVFVGGILEYVGILFVKSYLDSYQAGLLGGITRVSLLFTLLGMSIGQILFNRVSRYKKKEDIQLFIKKGIILNVFVVLLYFLLLPILPLIIKLTIGNEYLEALFTLKVILASVFLYILSIPIIALFYSFDKNNFFSLSGIIQLITIIAGNIFLVPLYGINGSAFTQLISRFSLFAFTFIYGYVVYRNKYSYEK